jgi:Uma2 family endonuclease
MTTRAITPPQPSRDDQQVPPLEAGDQLTRDEFERRYEATPRIKKAELIEGMVHMPPPAVRFDYHGGPHAELMGWLHYYRMTTFGVRVADNTSVRLDLENEPQPDAAMIIEPRCGGQTRLSSDGFLEGAPEFVAEVSATSVSIDMNAKLRVYRRNGVREYFVWRVKDRVIDWFALRSGEYKPLPQVDGIIRSDVFPGLWLDPDALINDDPASALRVLQKGLDSPEHAEFVARLNARAAGPSSQ